MLRSQPPTKGIAHVQCQRAGWVKTRGSWVPGFNQYTRPSEETGEFELEDEDTTASALLKKLTIERRRMDPHNETHAFAYIRVLTRLDHEIWST